MVGWRDGRRGGSTTADPLLAFDLLPLCSFLQPTKSKLRVVGAIHFGVSLQFYVVCLSSYPFSVLSFLPHDKQTGLTKNPAPFEARTGPIRLKCHFPSSRPPPPPPTLCQPRPRCMSRRHRSVFKPLPCPPPPLMTLFMAASPPQSQRPDTN